MTFQGSLSELHLPDIVQLMSVGGKTGVFHLTEGERHGKIYLRGGQIVHAELEELQGEEAVYTLAIWNRGEFRFEAGPASELRTISKSNTNLLMEAARRLDEWRVLSKKIPSTDHIPEFVILAGREGQINLNTGEWLVLSKIDGNRSIKEIARAAGLGVFDAAKILYGLVTTGLLRLRLPEPAADRGALARLDSVREAALGFLGSAGENVVARPFEKARAELAAGAGPEAIAEAIAEIVKATAAIKGPTTAASLGQLLGKL
jgi:hypothetical protein